MGNTYQHNIHLLRIGVDRNEENKKNEILHIAAFLKCLSALFIATNDDTGLCTNFDRAVQSP
ncbi:MAG: hypothetical protein DI539_23730 [Flavobacterium psychrophilum]|nr:MAG: hypothetical protein DI539_23730 [Flavobacterium psychrophilum]